MVAPAGGRAGPIERSCSPLLMHLSPFSFAVSPAQHCLQTADPLAPNASAGTSAITPTLPTWNRALPPGISEKRVTFDCIFVVHPL
jgi:hypothetical protein